MLKRDFHQEFTKLLRQMVKSIFLIWEGVGYQNKDFRIYWQIIEFGGEKMVMLFL